MHCCRVHILVGLYDCKYTTIYWIGRGASAGGVGAGVVAPYGGVGLGRYLPPLVVVKRGGAEFLEKVAVYGD